MFSFSKSDSVSLVNIAIQQVWWILPFCTSDEGVVTGRCITKKVTLNMMEDRETFSYKTGGLILFGLCQIYMGGGGGVGGGSLSLCARAYTHKHTHTCLLRHYTHPPSYANSPSTGLRHPFGLKAPESESEAWTVPPTQTLNTDLHLFGWNMPERDARSVSPRLSLSLSLPPTPTAPTPPSITLANWDDRLQKQNHQSLLTKQPKACKW